MDYGLPQNMSETKEVEFLLFLGLFRLTTCCVIRAGFLLSVYIFYYYCAVLINSRVIRDSLKATVILM